jgi:hypothetical protein
MIDAVFDRINFGIVDSIPTRGIDIWTRFSCLCCPEQVDALMTASFPPKKSYEMPKELIILKVRSEWVHVRGTDA